MLAAEAPVACSLHGYAETVAAFHRKYREGTFKLSEYSQVLDQFATDATTMPITGYRFLTR